MEICYLREGVIGWSLNRQESVLEKIGITRDTHKFIIEKAKRDKKHRLVAQDMKKETIFSMK